MKNGEDKVSQKRPRSLFRDLNLQIIFGITLMGVLGVASLTPAFPRVIRELGISPSQIGLLITVFTVPGVFLTPFLGVIADRVGRKRVLIPSLFLFGIVGFACGFVKDFNLLLILRFFQGAGAAALGSINVTLIGDLYEGRERAAAMGYNASVLSVGTALYPAIGGALAAFGWNYPFFLPVIAIPIGFLVLYGLKNPEPDKHSQPIIEYLLSVLKKFMNFEIAALFLASVMTFIILYGAFLTYLPLLLDESFKASTVAIGLLMSVMSISTALTSSQLGRFSKRFSYRSLLAASYVFYTLALVIFPFIPGLWLMVIPGIIFGFGHGLNFPVIQTYLAELSPIEYRGAFMSINGTVLRLGQTLGPIVMGLVYAGLGLNAVFYVGAAFGLVMICLMLLMLRRT